MMRKLLIVAMVALCCTSKSVQSQISQKVTVQFNNSSFTAFAEELEKQVPVRFYFNPLEVDSIRINLSADRAPFNTVLDKALANTGLLYSIDSRNRIYITKTFRIQTELAENFFTGDPLQDSARQMPDFDAGATQRNDKLKSGIENRLFEIGSRGANNRGKATVAGYIRDAKTGEPIIGATVYSDTPAVAVITDQFGYYSLTLPAGRNTIKTSSAGMKDTRRQVMLYSDGKLNIEMQEYVASLKAVLVVAQKFSNVKGTQMGVDKLNIKTIKQVPVVFGEADVLRVLLALPGVTSVGEASTGFNVRGGSTDQNLILFNDATIYNPSHLFGFFSAFNPDVVKGVELYKSAIPHKYGGRLSSVLDVSIREGNNKKFSSSGGIGPLTSKLTLEGPLIKEKSSFIIGARTTYSNWILKKLDNPKYRESKGSFYDGNLNLTHMFNSRNTVYLTGYLSNDEFRLGSDTTFRYSNRNANLKWKHIFNNRLYMVNTVGYDRYDYSIQTELNPVNAFKLKFDINQAHLRSDFNYAHSNKHNFNFGFNSILYKLHPGSFGPNDDKSLVKPDELQAEQAVESAFYAGDAYELTPELTVNAGFRYSVFNYLGPRKVYDYRDGVPREKPSVTDSTTFENGKNIQTWHGPEIRLAMRYLLSENSSVKLSFNTLRQYIHMLSNTTAISPTDIWKLSDNHIKPQRGYQVSAGYYKNFKSNTIETSVEVYFKQLKNVLDFKSGARLIMNPQIETDVINTRGRAYGAELLLKKNSGKVNGWLSYTYSRIELQQDDPVAGETINRGSFYPASYDKPHNLNFVGNYRFSHRFSMSVNVIYSTGRPITLPLATFTLGGAQRLFYSERNQHRIPDYFRTDLSFNLDGNHRVKQKTHNSWSFGVYNLTGRQNAYSVYFTQQNNQIKGYQLSIFGTLIPFVTYNFRF
jgi:hypothetical protein